MRSIIGFGALAAIAYYLFGDKLQQTANTVGQTALAAGNIGPNVKQNMLNVSMRDNSSQLTYDQWNYYFNQVRGVFARAFENTGLPNRDVLMTIDEWFRFANVDQATGLGLAGIGGFNMVTPGTWGGNWRKTIPNSGETLNIRRVN